MKRFKIFLAFLIAALAFFAVGAAFGDENNPPDISGQYFLLAYPREDLNVPLWGFVVDITQDGNNVTLNNGSSAVKANIVCIKSKYGTISWRLEGDKLMAWYPNSKKASMSLSIRTDENAMSGNATLETADEKLNLHYLITAIDRSVPPANVISTIKGDWKVFSELSPETTWNITLESDGSLKIRIGNGAFQKGEIIRLGRIYAIHLEQENQGDYIVEKYLFLAKNETGKYRLVGFAFAKNKSSSLTSGGETVGIILAEKKIRTIFKF